MPSAVRHEATMTSEPRTIGRMAMAWLPAGDYERALELWPRFAASDLIVGPDGPQPASTSFVDRQPL